jgi:hypothetical protein
MIAPKPIVLSAEPKPGSQTAAATVFSAGRAPGCGGTPDNRATSRAVTSGMSVVATATAAKPPAE